MSQWPVDIVYTWVDGSDPYWLLRNHAFLKKRGVEVPAASPRYANHDELLYSLRSVEQFLPWVNRIFILTDKQCPVWLDRNHPKLTVVDHEDVFKDYSYLPSFNSVAIETNLYRIPGLSEHFIYFNDDMIVGRRLEPSFFFPEPGRPYSFVFSRKYFSLCNWIASFGGALAKDIQHWHMSSWLNSHKDNRSVFSQSLRYTRLVINEQMGFYVPYHKTNHTPLPHTCSEMVEVEALFRGAFERCRKNQLRNWNDLFFPDLFEVVGGMRGQRDHRLLSATKDFLFFHLGRSSVRDLERLLDREYTFINVNDDTDGQGVVDLDGYHRVMNSFLPSKCSFEL